PAPPVSLGNVFWFGQNSLPFRNSNAIQHFVHGFLDPSIGFVKPARRFGSQLTQHITVPQGMKCIENAIRAHNFTSPKMGVPGHTTHPELRSAELESAGPDARLNGLKTGARFTQIDAPPGPKVAQFSGVDPVSRAEVRRTTTASK